MNKKIKRVIWIGLFAIVLYFCFGGQYNFYNLWKLNRQKSELEHLIGTNEQEREDLQMQIDKLKNDSTYIEKIAREKFRMGKQGEKIYIFKSEDKK